MMAVTNMTVGAPTSDGATFAVKGTVGPIRIAVADNESMTSPVFTSSTALSSNRAKVAITGLSPATRYWWQVEENGTINTGTTGQFQTLPTVGSAANFKFGWLFCSAGNYFPSIGTPLLDIGVTNAEVFDTIRTQALADDWALVINGGDANYYNWSTDVTESLANRLTSYDDILAQTRQHQLYREVPWWYTWSDHDYANNNSDGTYANKANAASAYRTCVPHYTLDDAGAIYQSTQIGRVLIVLWDTMYNRSPVGNTDNSSKLMLGANQMTWFENLLDTTTAEALILCSADAGWCEAPQAGDYSWAGYSTQRDEIVALVDTYGFTGKTAMLKGDFHRSRLDDGSGNPYGGWPTMLSGPIGSNPSGPNASAYSHGGRSLRESYGVVDVRDSGAEIAITLTGYVAGDPWGWVTLNTEGTTRITAGDPSHVLGF